MTVALAVVRSDKLPLDRAQLGPPQIPNDRIQPDLFMFDLSTEEHNRVFRDLWVGISCAVRDTSCARLFCHLLVGYCCFAPAVYLCVILILFFTMPRV